MAKTTVSEQALVDKLKHHALDAGRRVVTLVLEMYYALVDPDTPKWAKTVIALALIYFVVPLDVVPDFLLGGYGDDLATLLSALSTVHAHIKAEHQEKASLRLEAWFGSREKLPGDLS